MSHDEKCLCRMIRISKLCPSHVSPFILPPCRFLPMYTYPLYTFSILLLALLAVIVICCPCIAMYSWIRNTWWIIKKTVFEYRLIRIAQSGWGGGWEREREEIIVSFWAFNFEMIPNCYSPNALPYPPTLSSQPAPIPTCTRVNPHPTGQLAPWPTHEASQAGPCPWRQCWCRCQTQAWLRVPLIQW